jgi:hypothetical protein
VKRLEAYNGEYVDGFLPFNYTTLTVIIKASFGGDFDVDWMQQKWGLVLHNLSSYIRFRFFLGKVSEYLPIESEYFEYWSHGDRCQMYHSNFE